MPGCDQNALIVSRRLQLAATPARRLGHPFDRDFIGKNMKKLSPVSDQQRHLWLWRNLINL
jgi:hypothetical protein